jgi:outer membrane protein OmpA-like peptidoglycan-associated protein
MDAQVPIRLGVTTGVNFANQSFSRDLYRNDYPQTCRTGFILGGIAEFGITNIWSIQTELAYIQRGTKFQNFIITGDDPSPIGTTDATFKLDYFDLPIFLKARFESSNITPFLLIGPAFNIISSAEVNAPGTHVRNIPGTSTLDINNDVGSFEVAFDIGGGVEYQLDPKIDLLFDVRYSHGLGDVYTNPTVPSVKSYDFSLRAGLLFDLFGGVTEVASKQTTESINTDTDGDGLPDTDEINKYKTNPYSADTDADSLRDGDEIFKYKTNPLNPDTDGDRLSDGEEVNRYKTDPLNPDTDHGGVKDGIEVFRGTNPLDPSDDFPRKEEFKIDVGKSIVLEGIVFKTGSAEITASSAAILEKAYNTFQQNPDIIVEIHGHTDNVGKRAYNMKLSMDRANAVKEYLVQRGIAESRITTKGFGFDKPIVPNDSPENRQKNRRIEFFRIK